MARQQEEFDKSEETHLFLEDSSSDPFVARTIFPDAASIFSFRVPQIEEAKKDCIVILDTNVLLIPYTSSPKTLEEISRTYTMLAKQNRLLVPAHVAREFAKNRATKLSELHDQVTKKRAAATELKFGKYPLLESVEGYQAVLEMEDGINKSLADYKRGLDTVLNQVKSWNWDDPVSLLYSNLFTKEVVRETEITKDNLISDFENRKRLKIPPGYKDSSKTANAEGDLLIWHTILEIGKEKKKPVILVTHDRKPDWWHKSNGQPLYPRYELTDEFRRASDNQAIYLVSLSELLDTFGAEEGVVAEVRKEEQVTNNATTLTGSLLDWSANRIMAEEAILSWLELQFPKTKIHRAETRGVDFEVIGTAKGTIGSESLGSTGVHIFVTHPTNVPPHVFAQKFIDRLYRDFYYVETGTYTSMLACAVLPDREFARAFAGILTNREPITSVKVSIGVIENGDYNELFSIKNRTSMNFNDAG